MYYDYYCYRFQYGDKCGNLFVLHSVGHIFMHQLSLLCIIHDA